MTLTTNQIKNLPYRKTTVGMILNPEGEYLVVQKTIYLEDEWAFPGGGINNNETAEDALFRELNEELALTRENLKLIGESSVTYRYNWVESFVQQSKERYGDYYQGQEAIQFLLTFSGEKFGIKPKKNEIKKVKWVKQKDLPLHLIFPKQYEAAKEALQELLPKVTF